MTVAEDRSEKAKRQMEIGKEFRTKADDLRETGYSISEIAKKLGVTEAVVINLIH